MLKRITLAATVVGAAAAFFVPQASAIGGPGDRGLGLVTATQARSIGGPGDAPPGFARATSNTRFIGGPGDTPRLLVPGLGKLTVGGALPQ